MILQAGAQSPERLRIVVTNAALAAEPLDLSLVQSAELEIVTPRGDRVSWACEITNQTADSLTLEHAFLLNDVQLAGSYQIDVRLNLTAGVRRAGPTALQVIE